MMRTKRTVRSSKALQRRRRRRTRSSSSLPHFFPIPECSSRTATALGQLVHYANIFTLEREREESPHSFIHSSLSYYLEEFCSQQQHPLSVCLLVVQQQSILCTHCSIRVPDSRSSASIHSFIYLWRSFTKNKCKPSTTQRSSTNNRSSSIFTLKAPPFVALLHSCMAVWDSGPGEWWGDRHSSHTILTVVVEALHSIRYEQGMARWRVIDARQAIDKGMIMCIHQSEGSLSKKNFYRDFVNS